MDEITIFFIFIGLIILTIIPIIVVVKLFSIGRDINFTNRNINDLDRRISDLQKQTVNKDDIAEIIKQLQNTSIPKTDTFTDSEKVTTSPTKEEPISADKSENRPVTEDLSNSSVIDIKKQDEKEAVSEQLEQLVSENIDEVQHVTEKEVAEQTKVPEGNMPPPIPNKVLKEKIAAEHENVVKEQKSYAAAERIESEKPIYYKETISQPRTERVYETEKAPEKGFIENLMGANLLSKIGIVTLVLGIGFFVKYAIDQNWINEIGRVGIGLLTGGIIIGIAHKLRKKYDLFSAILVGGGISVFYITITLAFREYELFSQTVAFIILIAITIFSVILSLLYNRKELAIFSLLGGFASPLMVSTGSGNYIVLFSYILILNTGMLLVSFKKDWRVIGIISYVLTLIFFWTWLYRSFEDQFTGTIIFASLFFAQFYLLALIDHFRGGYRMTVYQAILILTNNLSLFLACMYVSKYMDYDIRGIATIIMAGINAIIMLVLFRRSEVDRNLIYMIIGVVMSFVSLAIPIQLHGHVITMFWAAEIVVLLWLWQKSRIKIFYIGFFIISALTLISYIIDVNNNYSLNNEILPIALNRIFITGAVVIAAFIISSFLLRKDGAESENINGYNTGFISNLFNVAAIIMTYIVPFLELNYQLKLYFDTEYSSDFRSLAMSTYTSIYIAALAIIFWRNTKQVKTIFTLLFISVVLYTIVHSILVTGLRSEIYLYEEYPVNYFLIHFVAIPAIALIIAYLVRKSKTVLSGGGFSTFCTALVILSVIILSIETDNVAVMLFGNINNYENILYDSHTFVYPILWGIIAMILMVWGLKSKEVILRKISLSFFGLIILKFYAYDVWHMSQAGRIVSFVILGIILLLVSFLQQKIKVLIKNDVAENEQESTHIDNK